jgi:hypothetical protein
MSFESNVTIIIPVFNLDASRLANYEFLASSLTKLPLVEVLVVEQLEEKTNNSEIEELAKACGFKYVPIVIPGGHIKKSLLINKATKLVNTDYLWVNDVDVVLPFSKVIRKIDDATKAGMNANGNVIFPLKFIQPFSVAVYLDEKQTNCLHDGVHPKIDWSDYDAQAALPGNRKYIRMYGAMSFIAKKSAFIDIGGMDEKFEGWGCEDNDLCVRVIDDNFFIVKDVYALHSYHHREEKHREALKNEFGFEADTDKDTTDKTEVELLKRNVRNYVNKYIHEVPTARLAQVIDETLIRRPYQYRQYKINILSLARTGSNAWLTGLKDSFALPMIGEPLSYQRLAREESGVLCMEDFLDRELSMYQGSKHVFNFREHPAAQKFGFEEHSTLNSSTDYIHRTGVTAYHTAAMRYLVDNSTNIFVTVRYNFFEWLVSICKAMEAWNWWGKPYSENKLTISRPQFMGHLTGYEWWHKIMVPRIITSANNKNIPCTVLEYDRHLYAKDFKPIFDNLGPSFSDKSFNIVSTKQKVKPAEEYVENLEEVKAWVKDYAHRSLNSKKHLETEFSECFYERQRKNQMERLNYIEKSNQKTIIN